MLKNFFKKKKVPKKFIFVVGSGRCGTFFFKELFKNNSLTETYHERNNLLTSFYQFAKFNNFKVNYEYLINSFKNVKIKKKIYFEASSYLSLNIFNISKSLNCKIVVLFRDPLKTCKSLQAKGWYNKTDLKNYSKKNNIGCHTESGIYFHHNFSRFIPIDKAYLKWINLPQIVKIKWFWNYIYKFLINEGKKLSKNKIRFINIDKFDYYKYLDLCNWFGCKPHLDIYNFKKISKSSLNKIKKKKLTIKNSELKKFYNNYKFSEKKLFKI